MIILASGSASRAAMLRAAGVPFEAEPPGVDEGALKAAMAGAPVADIADRLAELKAVKVSARRPGALVIGSDSMVALDRIHFLDKPGSPEGLRAQLRQLRGRRHQLMSAVVVARDGHPLWRQLDRAEMAVRAFSDEWLEAYVAAVGADVLGSVGGYHLEGLGVQLFTAVDGDHFTVRGLPLLPLIAWLRTVGAMPA